MIDSVLIIIKSGNGGNGAISGRHEKFIPRGGPDGGDGGNGGDVVLKADENESTLLNFRMKRVFEAGSGGNGQSKKKDGSNGKDVVVRVPIGTQMFDDEGNLLVDMVENNQEFVALQGGRGGYGNVKFSSSTNQYPVIAQAGEEGEEKTVRLELKLLADVGIVGMPNAGKSSLLTFCTAAKPKIADYPFTTLEPVLGMVEHKGMDFVMVDIPGLIEGAHAGVGLGDEFLKHVDRTKVLIHMVDGSGENPRKAFDQVNEELELYEGNLEQKTQILVLNKSDLEDFRVLAEDVRDSMGETGWRFHIISAATGEGVEEMMDEVIEALEMDEVNHKQREIGHGVNKDILPVLHPEPKKDRVSVHVENDTFIVNAPGVERIAKRIDYEDWTARMQLYRHMQKVGVVRELEEAGIKEGDTVRIGDVEWDWG